MLDANPAVQSPPDRHHSLQGNPLTIVVLTVLLGGHSIHAAEFQPYGAPLLQAVIQQVQVAASRYDLRQARAYSLRSIVTQPVRLPAQKSYAQLWRRRLYAGYA